MLPADIDYLFTMIEVRGTSIDYVVAEELPASSLTAESVR
jgi:hypothetical protein